MFFESMPLICLGCVRFGRFAEAIQIIIKMAFAAGVARVWCGTHGLLSTPATSAVIRMRGGKGYEPFGGLGILVPNFIPPFTEACTTSSVFTLVPLFFALPELSFSTFSTYNIPTCNPRLFGFWHALPSCMSQYYTHMLHNRFPQTTHIPLNKSCLNCGRMHLI